MERNAENGGRAVSLSLSLSPSFSLCMCQSLKAVRALVCSDVAALPCFLLHEWVLRKAVSRAPASDLPLLQREWTILT